MAIPLTGRIGKVTLTDDEVYTSSAAAGVKE